MIEKVEQAVEPFLGDIRGQRKRGFIRAAEHIVPLRHDSPEVVGMVLKQVPVDLVQRLLDLL